jgi:hypothetical protein
MAKKLGVRIKAFVTKKPVERDQVLLGVMRVKNYHETVMNTSADKVEELEKRNKDIMEIIDQMQEEYVDNTGLLAVEKQIVDTHEYKMLAAVQQIEMLKGCKGPEVFKYAYMTLREIRKELGVESEGAVAE